MEQYSKLIQNTISIIHPREMRWDKKIYIRIKKVVISMIEINDRINTTIFYKPKPK